MKPLVKKFGGTSVGTPEKIKDIARLLAKDHERKVPLVVTVSAMGKTTDDLLALAHQVSLRPPAREVDMLLTAGERISTALLSMALADIGVPAVSYTGSQVGLITDGHHRRARIQEIKGDRIRESLNAGQVVIVAGFQGVSRTKEVTTLGRGGTDTTAVALAIALGADHCEIYTDVDGIYSADPRVASTDVKKISVLPYDLMIAFASRGAGVLHPRSVQLAKKYSLPLWVGMPRGQGTWVKSREEYRKMTGLENLKFVGVTCDEDQVWVEVSWMRPHLAGAIAEDAQKKNLPMNATLFQEMGISFFTSRESVEEWKALLALRVQEGYVKTFEVHEDEIPLAVVGDCMNNEGVAMWEVLEKIHNAGYSARTAISSPSVLTCVVRASDADAIVKVLNKEFQ